MAHAMPSAGSHTARLHLPAQPRLVRVPPEPAQLGRRPPPARSAVAGQSAIDATQGGDQPPGVEAAGRRAPPAAVRSAAGAGPAEPGQRLLGVERQSPWPSGHARGRRSRRRGRPRRRRPRPDRWSSSSTVETSSRTAWATSASSIRRTVEGSDSAGTGSRRIAALGTSRRRRGTRPVGTLGSHGSQQQGQVQHASGRRRARRGGPRPRSTRSWATKALRGDAGSR